MLFWITALALSLAVGASLAVPLLRRRGVRATQQSDVALYRDQLAEIDRDLARGVITPEDAALSRTEVARRLLAADKTGAAPLAEAPRTASLIVAAASVAIVVGGAAALYQRIGAPGYPDLPLSLRLAASEEARLARMSQAEAERLVAAADLPRPATDFPQDYVDMVAQLREMVPQRPDDLQGWQLLARHEAALGNYGAAARAQERVIVLRGPQATTVDQVALVDLMVAAAGGFVSPEAEEVLRRILTVEPGNTGALYYLGLLYADIDRADLAFGLWRRVVDDAPEGSLHQRLARLQIEDVAWRAGIDYSLPPERGPDMADIAAARDLSDEDRAAMIRGMVDQLSTRLADEGGTAAEWARLISSLGVLGETAQAGAIWREAQEVFATSPAAMELLAEAAARAGLTE